LCLITKREFLYHWTKKKSTKDIQQPMWTGLPAIPYNEPMQRFLDSIEEVLSRYQDIKLCIIFGSIAKGRASSNSDLDIAVAAEQPLASERYLDLIGAFSTATNREIDLVDLMTATGLILKQALSTGIIVRNSNKALYARLISRMLFNQADMMPYFDRTLSERRKRFLNG
jgi:uncharacterized protein